MACASDGIARWDAGDSARSDAAGALPPDTVVTALLQGRDGALSICAEGMGLLR